MYKHNSVFSTENRIFWAPQNGDFPVYLFVLVMLHHKRLPARTGGSSDFFPEGLR